MQSNTETIQALIKQVIDDHTNHGQTIYSKKQTSPDVYYEVFDKFAGEEQHNYRVIYDCVPIRYELLQNSTQLDAILDKTDYMRITKKGKFAVN